MIIKQFSMFYHEIIVFGFGPVVFFFNFRSALSVSVSCIKSCHIFISARIQYIYIYHVLSLLSLY